MQHGVPLKAGAGRICGNHGTAVLRILYAENQHKLRLVRERLFLIYLIHAGMLTQLVGWSLRADIDYCLLTILGTAFWVLVITFGLSVLYEKLWGNLGRKWNISQRLTDFVLPER